MNNLDEILKKWWDNTGSGIRPIRYIDGDIEDYEEFIERVINAYNEHLKNTIDDIFTNYLEEIESEFEFINLTYKNGCLTLIVDVLHNGKKYPRIWVFTEQETRHLIETLEEKK
jgi:hypothetical protein